MAKVGRFVTDPRAGAYCQITLDSGEKIVITRSTISRNFVPSLARRIFDEPSRARASIGSKATLYPALMNASVVVAGLEKPLGSRWRNSEPISRCVP